MVRPQAIAHAFFVELGFGTTPTTTLESLARLLAQPGYAINLRPHWPQKGFHLWTLPALRTP